MNPEHKDAIADKRLLDFMKSSFTNCWDEFYVFCGKLISTQPAERFPTAFDFFESRNVYPKIEHQSMKSAARALRFKNLGNDRFGKGDFVEALKLYTKSVAIAPVGSVELAVAFANRSAALYKLERFEACLVDINRALNENYPDASKQKLHDRKKKCCSMLMNRRASEFRKSFQKLSLPKKSFRRDVGDNARKCHFDEDAVDMNYAEKFPLPKTNLENESISNASEKIKIEVDSTFGRHVVAAEDIEIGEIIGIEKPYASILKLDYQYSHCANCFVRCEALIPCPTCSAVMYCSGRCKNDAFAQSHRIECHLLTYLQHFPLTSRVWLSIRILMVITKQGKDLKTLIKHPLFKNPMKKAFDGAPNTVDSQDPVHLLNMKDSMKYINSWELANLKLFAKDMVDEKLLSAAVHMYRVMFIVNLLRNTPFFGASEIIKKQGKSKKMTEKEEYAGLLFLKLVSCTTNNAFDIREIHQGENFHMIANFDRDYVFVGSGLYMFHSFFNHSCFENVNRHFHKDTVVSRAIQPIKAGQQLFMSYGPSFIDEPPCGRTEFLFENYEFECSCEACKYDWPLFEEMSNHLEFLKNANISLTKLDRYTSKLHEKVCSTPVIEYNLELFDFLKEYLKMFYENFKTPSKELIFGFIAFRTLLQSQGNNYVFPRDKVIMSL